jgi:glutathione synthase/RimK-type ligase-like ATP-grasp enzyme
MDIGVHDFCVRESRAALLGGLLAQQSQWMSHPTAIWQAESKPYQLHMANIKGLPTPRTVVTSDPDVVRAAYRSFGSLVVKPVRSGHFRQGNTDYSIFTSQVSAADLDALDQTPSCPSIYQELVPKKFDVRVTIVGQRIFAAAIDSQSDPAASVDWRRTENPLLPHIRIDLPVSVQEQLIALMGALGLAFGCVDLVLTPSGEFVFLEVNPSGQWLWLDEALDFDITGAIAAWLGGCP